MKSLLLAFCLTLPLAAAAQWKEIPSKITTSFTNTAVAWDGKVYFTGGPLTQNVTATTYNKTLEILDLETETISPATGGLAIGRSGIASAAHEGKLYFSGGHRWIGTTPGYLFYDAVDVYDVETDDWSLKHLSSARSACAVAVVGDKIMFAGGYLRNGNTLSFSKVVDIYEPGKDKWTYAQLSQARGEIAAGVIGHKVWFCGGYTNWNTGAVTTRVDIYDDSTGLWSTAELSQARSAATVATVGKYLICAGGIQQTIGYSDQVDVLDTETNEWTTDKLIAPRFGMAAATLGNKAYFTGGGHINLAISYFDSTTNVVDIFDAEEKAFSTGYLTRNRMTHSCAAWGNKIACGGGWRAEQQTTTGSVEIFTDSTISAVKTPFSAGFTISPNPVTDALTIVFSENTAASKPSEMRVSDLSGRVLLRQKLTPGETVRPVSLQIERLPAGSYFLSVVGEGQLAGTRRFVVLR